MLHIAFQPNFFDIAAWVIAQKGERHVLRVAPCENGALFVVTVTSQ